MNIWIVFQLAVDIIFFGIIIFLVLKEAAQKEDFAAQMRDMQQDLRRQIPPPQPPVKIPADLKQDIKHLDALMDELAKIVMRGEKIANRIEKAIADSQIIKPDTEITTRQSPTVPRTPPTSRRTEINVGKKDTPPKEENSTTPELDEEPYIKAMRLIKKGLSDEEIGKRVGLPAHEITLIRKMSS